MLRPRKKLTKREIKKDPFLEKLAKLEAFVRGHSKVVSYVALGVVAAVVIIVLVVNSKQRASREASGELGLAELAIARKDYDDAIVRLMGIVDKYRGTKSASIAVLLLGQCYMYKADYDNALSYYTMYMDKYKNDKFLTATAYNGIGICKEAQGDYKEAARFYNLAAVESPYRFQKHEYLLNYAEMLLATGDVQEARNVVDNVLEDKVEYSIKERAEILVGKIKASR